MDIHQRCGSIKQRVSIELQGELDAEKRGQILIAALYELSSLVFPKLGSAPSTPSTPRSREYREGQGAALELVSFLAIHLIRNPGPGRRGVAVLTEIGEGCLDPFLKKKLLIYAQELLAKSNSAPRSQPHAAKRWSFWLLGIGAAAVLALHLAKPLPTPSQGKAERSDVAAPAAAPIAPFAYPPTANHAAAYRPEGAGGKRVETETEPAVQLAPEGRVAGQAEQTTKVRITNNQVLVPVTLKNGGETVRAELVLDTGSTRTAIHEELASRLRIDPRLAKASQSELADGRIIRSHIARLDSLGVGPFAVTSAEVEVFPYLGTEGIHDGLLGMDFLGKHRYQIDMEHELIRWF